MKFWRYLAALNFALAATLMLAAGPAYASAGRQKSFPAVRVEQPPAFDASLSDPAWSKGVVAGDFINLTTRQAAELSTTAYLVYDSHNLYIAFKVSQHGVHLVANQTTNNVGLGLDDFVAVGIDTSGNGAQVYNFYVTPRGVRYQKASESTRYDPPWQAVSLVNGDQWVAELIIPLKDLRAQGASAKWRINFARNLAAIQHTYTWAYDPRMDDAGDSTFWPQLIDIKLPSATARPRPHADIYGLLSAGSDHNLFPQTNGSLIEQPPRNYGVDFTLPFTSSLAFVGTFAPDFSNVETDQQTITPQEFQRRLTEYRPFFAQGVDFLTPGLHDGANGLPSSLVFYSPSIGPFDRGLKIEGTAKLNALGLLEAKGAGFDDLAFGLNHKTEDQNFRYFFDGVLARHADGRDSTLQVGLRQTNDRSRFEQAFQYTAEWGDFVPDAAQARSVVGLVDVSRPFYTWVLGLRDIGPHYNPIDGFTPLNDARGPFAVATVNGNGSGSSKIKQWDGGVTGERYLDRAGNVHEEQLVEFGDVTFKSLFGISISDFVGSLRTYPSGGNGYPDYTGGTTQPFHQTTIDFNYRRGTDSPLDVNYSWGPFATYYLQLFDASYAHPLGSRFSIAGELSGSRERFFSGGADSQWLRRFSIGESLGTDSNISIALRSISGTGGFANPGVDLALSFHKKFATGNELYVAYGTPAADSTLHRLIVKYVLHVGGGAGT